MKNISSIKTKNTADSPKTPGGISKSLLTPCRRVGLSRNWKKGGPSPFISPLSSKTEERLEKEQRKRKDRDIELQNLDNTPVLNENVESNVHREDINTTPSRNIDLPRRKRSKNMLSSLSIVKSDTDLGIDEYSQNEKPEIKPKDTLLIGTKEDSTDNIPSCRKSKSKKVPLKSPIPELKVESSSSINANCDDALNKSEVRLQESCHETTTKSPENLAKECIVVIQKKIFKKNLKSNMDVKALFDSDSDDVPLSNLNKNNVNIKLQPENSKLDEDDDFIQINKVRLKKSEDKIATGNVKKMSLKNKTKENKTVMKTQTKRTQRDEKPSSQSSYNEDDDDDFDINNKRTILIRKTYEKVPRPVKAKSTGSITQKDIDELKSRIEIKKKLLLAKAITKDTEELRDLVKKWQRGCQDALMELMQLMKNKFPDRQNMEFSDMLQMLKIPANLVGYDAENDCFVTPDDSTIILSKFNNI